MLTCSTKVWHLIASGSGSMHWWSRLTKRTSLSLRSRAPGESFSAHASGRRASNRLGKDESGKDRNHAKQRAWRALHRLPYTGPPGHEPDELGHVGHWLRRRGYAAAQAAEAIYRVPHAANRLSPGARQQPAGADADRSGAAAWLRRAGVQHEGRGFVAGHPAGWRIGSGVVWRRWAAHRQPRAEDRKRQRTDKPGHDAYVDLLGGVLFL